MKTTALIAGLSAASLTLMSFSTQARVSTDAEFRGYSECLSAAKRDSKGLVPGRAYLIERDGANAEYFINATRWENGERAYVRINCTTAARGQRLVSTVIEPGRFDNDRNPRVSVEIAQK